ncbi:MAG: hypothetical protein INR70_01360 [Parafilimonas terrae]|nr:hypothetical protein [Parafilimonas terrae]
MTDMTPIAGEAATRLAFSLMRRAYLDLARTLRSIEDEPACELLQAVENRLQDRLGGSAQGDGGETPHGDAIASASWRVRRVLREALEN